MWLLKTEEPFAPLENKRATSRTVPLSSTVAGTTTLTASVGTLTSMSDPLDCTAYPSPAESNTVAVGAAAAFIGPVLSVS